jgi:hypothetical protein
MNFVNAHPYLIASAVTYFFNNVITALVSSLPAPTRDSSIKYQYWFKAANTIIGNVQRAKSTAIEQSPNFQAAVAAEISRLQSGTH